VTVGVRPGWEVASAEDCLSGESFELREIGGWQEFVVPGVTDHRIVRLREA
jgi:hypothetical protein